MADSKNPVSDSQDALHTPVSNPQDALVNSQDALPTPISHQEIAEKMAGRVVMLPVSEVHPFEGNPYTVQDDEDMARLMDSIQEIGINEPILVRPDTKLGGFETLSGHRRMRAAELLGQQYVPVRIVDLTDEQALAVVADANEHRHNILLSDQAWALRMRYDGLRSMKGNKIQNAEWKTGNISLGDEKKMRSDEALGKIAGLSRAQAQRIMHLTCLIQPLMELADQHKLTVRAAYDLSFLSIEHQKLVMSVMQAEGIIVKPAQAAEIRKRVKEDGKLDRIAIVSILYGKDRDRSSLPDQPEAQKNPAQAASPPEKSPRQETGPARASTKEGPGPGAPEKAAMGKETGKSDSLTPKDGPDSPAIIFTRSELQDLLKPGSTLAELKDEMLCALREKRDFQLKREKRKEKTRKKHETQR